MNGVITIRFDVRANNYSILALDNDLGINYCSLNRFYGRLTYWCL